MTDKAKNQPDGLEFDLTQVTAQEVADFNKAVRAGDPERMAAFYARVTVRCPWGDPADPKTYLALPYFTTFNALQSEIASASKKLTAA